MNFLLVSLIVSYWIRADNGLSEADTFGRSLWDAAEKCPCGTCSTLSDASAKSH
jgi:hypothetical protein